MTQARRGVTRGYVAGLILAAVIGATALTVAIWGLLALALARDPISTTLPIWAGPLTLLGALALLAGGLWLQALALLRGRQGPHWAYVLALGGGSYLLWCLVGTAAGLESTETWASPFAISLIPVWVLASLLFWAVLARRVYSDRGTPRWPWERDDDLGPDWANYGLDPWSEGPISGDPDAPGGDSGGGAGPDARGPDATGPDEAGPDEETGDADGADGWNGRG